jgi:hypothetical protein
MELTKYYLFRRSEMSVFFLALNQKEGGVNDMARSEKKGAFSSTIIRQIKIGGNTPYSA